MTFRVDSIVFDSLASDPGSPVAGQRWFNSATGKHKHYDGTTVRTLDDLVNNFSATVAPDESDDSTGGYSVGSMWADVTADAIYVCIDATATAAVWVTFGGTATIDVTPFYNRTTSVFDDMDGYIDGFSNIGSMGWRLSTITGGGISEQSSEAGHSGIWRITSGTGAGSQIALREAAIGNNGIAIGGSTKIVWEYVCRLQDLPDGTDDFEFECGFSDDWADGGSIFHAILLRVSRSINATNWVATTLASGSVTNTSTGVPFAAGASEWAVLRFDVAADGSEVEFYIDGALVATHATNIPTATMGYGGVIRKVAGAVAARVDIDAVVLTKIRGDTPIVGAGVGGGGGLADGDYGDITVGGTGTTLTVDAGAITLAKMADMATASLLGRTTAGAGAPEVLSAAQATALLDAFTSALKGLVPASGGGTTNFLRADGTWAAAGGGGGATVEDFSAYNTSDTTLFTASPTTMTLDATDVSDAPYTLAADEVTIGTTGRYVISWSCSLDGHLGGAARTNAASVLQRNGTDIPGTKSEHYIRQANHGATGGGVKIMDITAGDVIRIQAQRDIGAGTVRQVANGTRMTIRRIS